MKLISMGFSARKVCIAHGEVEEDLKVDTEEIEKETGG
jgi:hypothetical protein